MQLNLTISLNWVTDKIIAHYTIRKAGNTHCKGLPNNIKNMQCLCVSIPEDDVKFYGKTTLHSTSEEHLHSAMRGFPRRSIRTGRSTSIPNPV